MRLVNMASDFDFHFDDLATTTHGKGHVRIRILATAHL